MEYPHRQYLVYLLSKRLSPFEVMAECTDKGILPPSEEDLKEIATELGPLPKTWKATVSNTDAALYRWLRNKGVLPLWRKTAPVQEALDLLRRSNVRKDFEALMTMHKSESEARDELRLKYPEAAIPSIEGLEIYSRYFWDLGSMSYEGIFSFLATNQEREELLPAIQGDLATTYGRLGLRQRIESEQFYDNIIALANQQVEMARRNGHNAMNGSSLMGIAALTRQAMDAISARDELHREETVSALDIVREQASAFKLRMVEQESIPSFDEIRGEIIDAEFSEATNVRQIRTGSGTPS